MLSGCCAQTPVQSAAIKMSKAKDFIAPSIKD
jgi:hypothetical protein